MFILSNCISVGFIERGLNRLGRAWWSSKMVPFNFAMHAEHKTAWDLDHVSAGNEASTTCIHQKFLFDKLCKWFTVEGQCSKLKVFPITLLLIDIISNFLQDFRDRAKLILPRV